LLRSNHLMYNITTRAQYAQYIQQIDYLQKPEIQRVEQQRNKVSHHSPKFQGRRRSLSPTLPIAYSHWSYLTNVEIGMYFIYLSVHNLTISPSACIATKNNQSMAFTHHVKYHKSKHRLGFIGFILISFIFFSISRVASSLV
jgi:hypothetical protein